MAQIIPHTSQFANEQHWQNELAQCFKDPHELLRYLELPEADFVEHIKARKLFPMMVPRSFAQRIEKGNPYDPLLLQVLPDRQEFDLLEGYITDPLDEQNTALAGLLHKYKSRVLLMVRGGCAVNCRYCFRRHFPYADNALNKQNWPLVCEYLLSDNNINEVILSGGDPLMADDDHLAWLVSEIEKIGHISRLRIHTRLPVVIPNRITEKLLELLSKLRLKSIMVLHINHANEIDLELSQACQRIAASGVVLLNQSVLLKGINDNAESLTELSEKLFSASVLPYYLHLLDKVAGAAHFDTSESKAKALINELNQQLPGYLVPKLVREIAGEKSKTPIV